MQTILCCVAGLPCSPLWLCGLYIPAFAPLNAVFIPPQWFAVSIFFIQCFTLLIPCYQVYRHHTLKTETLAVIADWEAKNKAFGSVDTDSTKINSPSQTSFKACDESEKGIIRPKSFKSYGNISVSSKKSQMYTMTALEHAIKWNPVTLQKFAALKDFSGENISFLTHLQAWKKTWAKQDREKYSCKLPSEREAESRSDELLRGQFNRAIKLYAAFVSGEHAEFPINIPSRTMRALDDLFANPADLLYGDTRSQSTYNSVAPFDELSKAAKHTDIELLPHSSSDNLTPEEVWYWGDIPEWFGANVFDEAEAEIKYLVLTNTWPKFVNAGYADQIHDAEGRSLSRRLTQFFKRDGMTKL